MSFLSLYSLSLNDQDTLMEEVGLIKGKLSCNKLATTATSIAGSSSLWPPLKSARYCKKQRNRNGKGRGITPSIMLMHESSINHHRVTTALNELSTNTNGTNGMSTASVFDLSHVNSKPFWSKRTCQEFWNEYLECDSTLTHDLSLLTLKSHVNVDDHNCPQTCYTKITKSIRKLLRRTFTGAPSFSELETLVKSFNQGIPEFQLSCGQVLYSSESAATIKLDTPFHRVWLHAICQYHGLSSQSKTVNDQRLVHIKTMANNPANPRINLYNFLLEFV